MVTFKSLFSKIYEIKINEILNYFFINFKILQAYFFSLRTSKNILYLKKNFLSFSEVNSIAYTFYKIQNLNFTKFGNYGVSDLLDYKKYNLANFWHVSRLSVLIYSKYGCLVTLLGNFLFVLLHFIFISNMGGGGVIRFFLDFINYFLIYV